MAVPGRHFKSGITTRQGGSDLTAGFGKRVTADECEIYTDAEGFILLIRVLGKSEKIKRLHMMRC